MPTLTRLLSFTLIFVWCNLFAFSQSHVLKQLSDFPSNEIYDLFTDSKGFLWIAHNGGIAKYDGISFTSFSSLQQSSLSTTGLLEDKHGRIWFNNFSGQIFYIENGHMNKLDAYKSADENDFPRIGLFNDLLIATTKKGLFICNTNTLKCHYEQCVNFRDKGTTSLSILKNKVVAYGKGDWFVYEPDKGLKLAVFENKDKDLIKYSSSTLSVRSYNDTAFLFINPSNNFYKIIATNDTVRISEKKIFNSFINTVSVLKNGYWVNSVNSSNILPLPKNDSIKGYNISSISTDNEGNTWYGSLQQGLLTDSLRTNKLKEVGFLKLDKSDRIKCIINNGQKLFLGTQKGNLLYYDVHSNKSGLMAALPAKLGGISYLKMQDTNNIWVGTSVNTYIFNINNRQLTIVNPVKSLKQADLIDGTTILACAKGLIILPDQKGSDNFYKWKAIITKKFKGLTEGQDAAYKYLFFEKRCKAVCYSSYEQTIWFSSKDGLYQINSKGVVPFYFNNDLVYASCLTAYSNKIIAGTFNNGVFVIGSNGIKHFTLDDGLLSNNVLHVKVIADKLWIYTSGAVQIFDLQSFKLINKYALPGINEAFLTDADELNGNCYFSALNGLYEISAQKKTNEILNIYLNSLYINGRDTGLINQLILPSTSNDIQVSLGTPYLFNARDIFIKYRLRSSDSSKWVFSRPGERNFHFASLMPGKYMFEAFAIKPQTGLSSHPLIISFIILQPWWQTWWFRSFLIIVALLIIAALLRQYYDDKLLEQKIKFEKVLVVEKERQHISREIHDHIGQALSVIKLNLNMGGPSQISEAQDLISEVIKDLRQFTHGLYYGKLLMNSLAEVIKKDIDRINISEQLVASLEIDWSEIFINEQNELLVYRIFQEAINNILKHANAKNITVYLSSNKKQFKLIISDDGKGFIMENAIKGLGLDNMRKRAELANGQLHIFSKPNNGCRIELIIDHL